MSENVDEPTATEICDMLLKADGVIALAVFTSGYIGQYLKCVPDSTLWSALGPVVFVAVCCLFAGRVVIWNILGPTIAVIPVMAIRALVRLALCAFLAYGVASAGTVFSPAFSQKSGECPSYTVYKIF